MTFMPKSSESWKVEGINRKYYKNVPPAESLASSNSWVNSRGLCMDTSAYWNIAHKFENWNRTYLSDLRGRRGPGSPLNGLCNSRLEVSFQLLRESHLPSSILRIIHVSGINELPLTAKPTRSSMMYPKLVPTDGWVTITSKLRFSGTNNPGKKLSDDD
jgi:hypothetical protein